jgi:hypothetical protein
MRNASVVASGFLAVVPIVLTTGLVPVAQKYYHGPRVSTLHAASLDVDIHNLSDSNDNADSQKSSPPPLPSDMLGLPRHSHSGVNTILEETEDLLKKMHEHSKAVDTKSVKRSMAPTDNAHDAIYANTYVDLGKVDTVGFDYDYTLVHYTDALLELLYDMALTRLVNDRYYPAEMLTAGMKYDPFFSIRGLAVDKETGWITHLSYTHKVAVAWEGRQKVETSRIYTEYRGKRVLNPKERKNRLKPLNDLFSMAECCLIADTLQYFKDNTIDFCPSNTVTDVLGAIRDTHISGDFHRLVAKNPEMYFDPTPHLNAVLTNLKDSGKRLIFARYACILSYDAVKTAAFSPNRLCCH